MPTTFVSGMAEHAYYYYLWNGMAEHAYYFCERHGGACLLLYGVAADRRLALIPTQVILSSDSLITSRH